MARFLYGLLSLLAPAIFLAVPAMVASVICGVLGIALRNRPLLLTAAALSVPMFLYVLMGEAWWRPAIPFVVAMYFAAAYAVPQRRRLALLLVAPYFVFFVMMIESVVFRQPESYPNRIEWHANSTDSRP